MNDHIDTMRVITEHAVDPATEKLTITALDAPGAGGASHLYQIEGFDSTSNAAYPPDIWGFHKFVLLLFQNGPIPEVGVNGITNEALLAIVADRLRGFQSGPFACRENRQALGFTVAALEWLKLRAQSRMQRGVEGTHAA